MFVHSNWFLELMVLKLGSLAALNEEAYGEPGLLALSKYSNLITNEYVPYNDGTFRSVKFSANLNSGFSWIHSRCRVFLDFESVRTKQHAGDHWVDSGSLLPPFNHSPPFILFVDEMRFHIQLILGSLASSVSSSFLLKINSGKLAIPIFEGHSYHTDNAKWFEIDYGSTTSSRHSKQSCPVFMECDKAAKSFFAGGSQVVGLDWEEQDLPFPGYADVHGIIALGPNSPIGKAKTLFFHQHLGKVVMHVADEIHASQDMVVFDLLYGFDYRAISADLEFEITQVGRDAIRGVSEITIDFSSPDLTIPEAAFQHILKKKKNWRIQDSRLFVGCHKGNGESKRHLFDFKINGIYGNTVNLSVVRTKEGRSGLCPTNLVLDPENRVVIGSTVLDHYDIAFDGPYRQMVFVPVDASSRPKPVYTDAMQTNRYSLESYGSNLYELGARKWSWIRSINGNFYFTKDPRVQGIEPGFEIYCFNEQCKRDLEKLYGERFKMRWIGTPDVVMNEKKDIQVVEARSSLIYKVLTKNDETGKLFSVIMRKAAHRALVAPSACIEGRRIEFRPHDGKFYRNEFLFLQWPPVMNEKGSIDLVYSGFDDYTPALPMERITGEFEIIVNSNNAVIIQSTYPADAFVPERAITTEYNVIKFGSERQFRYCLRVPKTTEGRIVFEPNLRREKNCELEVFFAANGNELPLSIQGSTGRFSVPMKVPYSRSLLDSLTNMEWRGEPVMTVDQAHNIIMTPSSEGFQRAYDVVLSGSKLEFIAKAPRFKSRDCSILTRNEFTFEPVNGQSVDGEFMVNLYTEDENEPIAFSELDDGTYELLLSQVVTKNRRIDDLERSFPCLFPDERKTLWHGRPVIDLYADGKMVIKTRGADGSVFRLETNVLNETDILLRFVPV